MKERPIIMQAESVRAILDGRKTQTRRVMKHPEKLEGLMLKGEAPEWCPHGKPGDRLWVRETFCIGKIVAGDSLPEEPDPIYVEQCIGDNDIVYKEYCIHADIGMDEVVWKPSIHMFRKDSRILLEITDIRVERVQDISVDDIRAEGIMMPTIGPEYEGEPPDPWMIWEKLWDSINKKRGYGWDKSPWVWVLEFKRIKP